MRIYLDHNATTPVDSAVLEEMLPFLKGVFGNPSSVHAFGQEARRGLDLARERVAALIGATPEEIVFTSGGTEADNHAVRGVLLARGPKKQHVITTAIEHQAVLNVCHICQQRGARITYLGVDASGVVNPEAAREALGDETCLVSVMAANNDVGTVEPVTEIAAAAREKEILVHSDAVQAVGKIPIDVEELGVDLMSMSSHKIHGPKGVGALYIRRGTRLAPILHGGHHESRRRAGTENLPGIVGFGKACELAGKRLEEDAAKIRGNRDRLEAALRDELDRVQVHGHPVNRLPGTLNIGFEDVEGETLLMALDLAGIAASTGSACSSDSRDPSHVLAAMGCHPRLARGSVRFSLGRDNNVEQIDRVAQVVIETVRHLRTT